jgi:hypothetical protein
MSRELIAIVVSDPDERNFSQVRIPELFPEGKVPKKDLPYAQYKLPVGAGFNEGTFVPAKIDHWVWVDFPFLTEKNQPDTRRPRITGSVHYCPDGLPNLPHDAFNGIMSLDGLHQYPKINNAVDPDYEATKDSVVGRSTAFTKEGFNFRVQNGALTVTHLKTGARYEISESGHFDLFTPQNGFIRVGQKLKIIAGELILKSTKAIGFDLPELDQTIKTWKLKTSSYEVTSTGIAKIVAKAMQLITDTDFSVASQGRVDMTAQGAMVQRVNQDLTATGDYAWGAELSGAGGKMAAIGIDKLGFLVMENAIGGTLKGLLDEKLTKLDELVGAAKDLITDTGTGPGKTNIKSVNTLMQIKIGLAQLKMTLALIFK